MWHVATHGDNGGSGTTHRYAVMRTPKVAILAPLVVMICATPIAMTIPALSVIYLIPIAVIVWLLRRQTTADSAGITVRTTFGKRFLSWSALSGLSLTRRSTVRAVLGDGSEAALPSVRTRHLPVLALVSGGRIHDPTGSSTAGAMDARPAEEPEGAGTTAQTQEGAPSNEPGA